MSLKKVLDDRGSQRLSAEVREAKDAVALWKEGREIARRTGSGATMRAMTDLVGPFYTLVMEEQSLH
jgi:hypothetical protein